MSQGSPFNDKIAIITGGASGIGRAIGEIIAKKGATVVLADINADGAEEVAKAINASGGKARGALLDVSNADDVGKLVEDIASEYGRLDYMFNNAGFAISAEVRNMTIEDWRGIIDVNLWGVIYGTMAAYPLMIKQGFGHIVNTASAAGLVGVPLLSAYCTTKHAVVGFTTALRHEGAALGVKATVLCPGFIKTGIFDAASVIGATKEEFTSQVEPMAMDLDIAARKLVRGVEKNKMIVNFPFSIKFMWWLYRLNPSIPAPLLRKSIRDFRDMTAGS
jgi:NAD(P)-dependent dehydrogenase (short-subunit alcohol dehydrogenase family)